MSTRNTWVDAVGTLLTVFVSLIVAVALVGGLLAFWAELRPEAPAPAVAEPDAGKPLQPSPTGLAVIADDRASDPVEVLTLEAPAEHALQDDQGPWRVDVPVHLIGP